MSTPQTPPREATYADLEALPPPALGQIIGGRLYVSPLPALPHALAASALNQILGTPFQRAQGGPGGWWLLFEPELHFPQPKAKPDVLVPDLAGWRKERLPDIPDATQLELAPDWVCEI